MKNPFAITPRTCLACVFVAALQYESCGATIIGSTAFEGPPDFSQGYYYTYNGDYAGYGNGGANVRCDAWTTPRTAS